jgi:sugar lactone lactonase YvrE
MSESLSTVLTALEPTLLTTGWGHTEGPLWHTEGMSPLWISPGVGCCAGTRQTAQ